MPSKDLGVHQESNSQNGSSLGSVRVHSPTLSYTLKSMKCDFRASLLAHTFASLCLGSEPKARVVTFSPIKRISQCPYQHFKLFFQCNCFHLNSLIVDFYDMALPQVNLGVPKFSNIFLVSPTRFHEKPLTFVSLKDLN